MKVNDQKRKKTEFDQIQYHHHMRVLFATGDCNMPVSPNLRVSAHER